MKPINKFEVYKELQEELLRRKTSFRKQLFSSSVLTVLKDDQSDYLYAIWKTISSDEGYKILYAKLEALLTEYSMQKLFNDSSAIILTEQQLLWIFSSWLPGLTASGTSKIAWAIDERSLQYITRHSLTSPETVSVKFFLLSQDARKWLSD